MEAAPPELANIGVDEKSGQTGTANADRLLDFIRAKGYEVDWIPSMRMVIDLSDLAASTAGV
mgnify:CR=1 FL=1